jgi:hypothetical protein
MKKFEPFGKLQFWLQGWPNKERPWVSIWLGNKISDIRFYWWRFKTNFRKENNE